MRRNEPQRPIGAMPDADPRRHLNLRRPQPRIANLNFAARHKYRHAVLNPRDPEGPRQSPRPGHARHSPDQHATRRTVRFRHDVQAFVHAVDQVHIRTPRRAKNNACPRRYSPRGMRRPVVGAKIRFHLHNRSRRRSAHQHLS